MYPSLSIRARIVFGEPTLETRRFNTHACTCPSFTRKDPRAQAPRYHPRHPYAAPHPNSPPSSLFLIRYRLPSGDVIRLVLAAGKNRYSSTTPNRFAYKCPANASQAFEPQQFLQSHLGSCNLNLLGVCLTMEGTSCGRSMHGRLHGRLGRRREGWAGPCTVSATVR